jgi:hypothetical protein
VSVPIPFRSLFVSSMTVMVDPWSVNPLLDDAQQSVPQLVNAATITNGEPPTMFDSGYLPPFTGRGVDPRFLALMRWKIRHAVAMDPNATRVLTWVEQYGHDTDVDMPTQGQHDYVGRFRGWLAGKWTNPNFAGATPEQKAEAEGDVFDSLFAATDAAHAAKIAAVNAANPVRPRTAEGIAAFNRGRAQR